MSSYGDPDGVTSDMGLAEDAASEDFYAAMLHLWPIIDWQL